MPWARKVMVAPLMISAPPPASIARDALPAQRIHAEQSIRRTEIDEGRRQRHEADEAPPCLRADENQAQQEQTRDDADDAIGLTYVRFHDNAP
jgi:hypothetical protein